MGGMVIEGQSVVGFVNWGQSLEIIVIELSEVVIVEKWMAII